LLSGSKSQPKGQLRVNATLGFGRLHVASAISQYVLRYSEVDVRLQLPSDLVRHNCICRRQGDEADGTWRLHRDRDSGGAGEAVKVRGNLTTNDGEIAVNWALDGHGILMRAEWDLERYLDSGRLVRVLPQYRTPDTDIYAVYPQHQHQSARTRSFVAFLSRTFERFALNRSRAIDAS
jgi:DNA-binding transcriptional LysR family regulator